MNLRELEYFYETAQTQNISRTAEKFLVPASTVSTAIKKLEKELENMKNESKKAEEKLRREYEAKEKEMLDMLDSM